MKKQLQFLLLVGSILCFSQIKAQVGIGTPMPDASAELDVVSQDKGILIPRVALSSTQDMETISSGNVESLLVFNTASSTDIKPGYYYWFANRWHRVVTADDVSKGGVIDNVVVYDSVGDVFNYINNSGDQVTVNLENLVKSYETLTSIIQNADGTFTFIDEEGKETVLDVSGMETLTDLILDPASGELTYTDEAGVVTIVDLATVIDNLETVTTLVENADGTFTFTDEDGTPTILDVSNMETLTTIVDNGDGTYTYTNEDGTLVVLDGNTTSVTSTDGVYVFTDASGNVITSIDTNASANGYDNTSSGLTAGNVQNAIDEVVSKVDVIENTKGDLIVDGGLEFIGPTDGTDKLLADTSVRIADGGITNIKLADDAVTNAKLSDNAVNTENITDGAVDTADLADGSVTAGKINSGTATLGELPIADGTGGITYGNVSSSNVDGQDFTSSDLIITGGTGATLTTVTAEIADGAVDTDALAADAVTNAKLADNAVNTENITDGAVDTADLADGSVTAGKINSGTATLGELPIADGTGGITYGNVSSSNVDGQDFTSNDLIITGGTGATLTTVTAEIADGAVDTDALAADAVTNAKLADNAVNTENITDGAVDTADLADGSVTAGKLVADSSQEGMVGVVQADGSVTYQNLSSSNVEGQDFTSNDLIITGGTGATLTTVTAEIADGAVDTDALAADAVTNAKLADNAVNTENITDGAVEPIDLNANVAGAALSQDGDTMALNVNANNGLSISDDNVQLGGALIEETAITTDVDNTLAIVGLQTGATQDNLVVVDPVSGVLKQTKAAMPKFFYMPSIVFDVSTTGMASRNLHEEYIKQFTGTGNPTLVGSTGAPTDIPNLPNPEDLYYYVTYYDHEIFEAVSISETGIMTYNVKSTSPTEASFMNIVFVVK